MAWAAWAVSKPRVPGYTQSPGRFAALLKAPASRRGPFLFQAVFKRTMAGFILRLPEMSKPSPYKSTGGLIRIIRALGYSLQGLGAAWRHEAAFRQELALAVILTPIGLWLGSSTMERLLLVGVLALVLVVELINSAIEALADAISTDHHPLLGRAKDIGSAAVLLVLLLAGATWICVLTPLYWPT